ncbi:MAG: hypothetical protein B7Y80_01430 [Hyphomicrobium sp. 32-62-53]|nr:MAG: hypothetical protein B7Z29_01775 [Hyphomicrobium sp. 12-62-95]OYY01416.1 MAG: hypothetical protein B7Y80_01430 [Hyphomicrobium sp. 32-62-53]
MAKKSDAAASPPAVIKHVFDLAVAVPMADGSLLKSLEIEEPELRHRIAAQRERRATESETFARYVAILAGIPEEAAQKIKHRDARKIKAFVDDLKGRGVGADLEAERAALEASGGVPPMLASSRTFTLLVPVATDGAPLTEITVEEPDIAAGIAVEKFKTEAEQSAALIATCSGQVIPLISRMKECDVLRIERWLNFFLNDGEA